jgi:RepB DNA-primase from phage plasmid
MSRGEPMRDLVAYLTVLAGPEPAGRYVELRYRGERGMSQRFTDAARPTEAAAAIAALSRSRDVYVGCAPRRRRAGGKDAITEAWTLWVDCDTQQSIDQLAGFAPQPAIVIRSGRGLHAYWPLAAPLAREPLERANRRLAYRFDACESAVTNIAAILRPPGTANFKYDPPAPVVLTRFTGERSPPAR